MAKPIKSSYRLSKDQLFELINKAVDSSDFLKEGQDKDLGLMSIDVGKDYLLYLHIVETEAGKTELFVAPGFPFMKDRDQSELPADLINSFIQTLNDGISI